MNTQIKDIGMRLHSLREDSEITIEEMASKFNLSEPYISKYIKDKSGKTFGEHVVHIRMKKAKSQDVSLTDLFQWI